VDLSVIIVSYKVPGLLDDCLASLFAQTQGLEYEVFVVDNAPGDGSAEMVRDKYPQVTLLEPDDNLGFAGGNNHAAKRAAGRRLLLLNPDTVVLDGAIQKLWAFAESKPEAGIVGGRTVRADGSLEPTCCWADPGLWPLLCKATGLNVLAKGSRLFDREAMGWWQRDDDRQVDIITGCFLMIERELWERVGGFDPRFFMYAEEVDLCWRVRNTGKEIWFAHEPEVIHLVGASAGKASGSRTIAVNKAILQLFHKHRGWAYCMLADMLMVCGLTVRSAGLGLMGVLKGGERKQRAADLGKAAAVQASWLLNMERTAGA
jgi:hypothetical protein